MNDLDKEQEISAVQRLIDPKDMGSGYKFMLIANNLVFPFMEPF